MTDQKTQTKRIFDQPDHPQYGPVRRLHIMLMQLFGEDLQALDDKYNRYFSRRWDEMVVFYITDGHFTFTEAAAHRRVLRAMMERYYS